MIWGNTNDTRNEFSIFVLHLLRGHTVLSSLVPYTIFNRVTLVINNYVLYLT